MKPKNGDSMAESDFFFDFSPYYRHFSEKNEDNKCNMN